jgi:GATA-binding protein
MTGMKRRGCVRGWIMKHEFAPSPMEDLSMEMGPTRRLRVIQAVRPGNRLRLKAPADVGSIEWDSSSGSLSRTHASTQLVSNNHSRNGNERRQKFPRAISTPGTFEQMSNPNSPPNPSNMSGFSSIVPSRPSSPSGKVAQPRFRCMISS